MIGLDEALQFNKSVAKKTPLVLLVDDQPMVAEAVRRMLASENDIEFHYCNDPSKAVEVASELNPTIILQDLVMPEMDGISLVKFYRANKATANVPIIVLSTKEDPRDKSLAFSVGASDYLVKLPDKIELVARIRAHTRNYITQQERDDAFRRLAELQIELQESNAALQMLSCLDGLTGIANRRRFDEFMSKEWMRARREKSEISLVLVDVDFFKSYNDNYGHQQGDDTLIKVAQTLRQSLQRPADLLARYGGEEFVLVLPDTELIGAMQLAESFRQRIADLKINHDFSDACPYVTISMGVATCKPVLPENTPEKLIEKADKALYAAKRRGRNQVLSYKDI